MATVLILGGPGAGEWYCVPENRPLVVGQDVQVGARLARTAAAVRHLEIRCDPRDGRYYALDLGAPSGVHRNGRRIPPFQPLDDGDCLEVGDTRLLFTRRDFATEGQAHAFLNTHADDRLPDTPQHEAV
ncbi:MAG: FHA domain-containing protein [Phycisphaeraceae bacterium]